MKRYFTNLIVFACILSITNLSCRKEEDNRKNARSLKDVGGILKKSASKKRTFLNKGKISSFNSSSYSCSGQFNFDGEFIAPDPTLYLQHFYEQLEIEVQSVVPGGIVDIGGGVVLYSNSPGRINSPLEILQTADRKAQNLCGFSVEFVQPITVTSNNASCNVQVEPGAPVVGGEPAAGIVYTDSLDKYFPCVTKLVVNELGGMFTFYTLPFSNSEPQKPNLYWQVEDQLWGDGGSTTYVLGSNQTQGYSSIITLNKKALQNASKLYVATAVIHESVHAYSNFLIKSAKYGLTDPPLNMSWASTVDYWTTVDSLYENGQANYRDHTNFLETYWEGMVSTLKDYMGNANTLRECQMAMLYGLNNPGASFPPGSTQAIKLNGLFEKIKTKYGITSTELDNFNSDNIKNVPTSKKVPSNCP